MGAQYSGQRYGSYSLPEIIVQNEDINTMWRKEFTISCGERVRVTASVWVWIALGVLVLSNLLYMVAFCTDGWGILQQNDGQGTWFAFGLWQQCSHPHFLCFSPGDSPAFGAARAFAVLGLFGHVFSVGLLLGYIFEKILDFDDCMIISWTSVCFATGTFVFISVVIFGLRWPIESNLPGTTTWLSYSFGMSCVSVILQMFAGAMGVMEITTFVPSGDPSVYLAHIEDEKKQRRQRSERRGYRSEESHPIGTVTDIV